MSDYQNTPSVDDDVLKRSIKQIERAYECASKNIRRYQDAVKFNAGDQWDSDVASDYDRKKKPRLTFNRVYAYIKTIIGEQVSNTTDWTVRATSTNTPQSFVDLRSGVLRHIAYANKYHEIKQHAFKYQLMGGYGGWQVYTDYESETSFNQVIKIKKIKDATRIYYDPDAEESTKADGKFIGVTERMLKKAFDKEYPKQEGAESAPVPDVVENSEVDWGNEDYITIAHHYVKEYYDETLSQLEDGTVIKGGDSEIKAHYDMLAAQHDMIAQQAKLQGLPEPELQLPEVVKTRTSKCYKIMYYKLVKNEILEEKEWPGRLLPIVFADGDTIVIDGVDKVQSFTTQAEDAQKFYNFVMSNIAESLKSFRKEQWLVTPSNIQGKLAEIWKEPELVQGALVANPDAETGAMPIKVPASELPVTLINTKEMTEEDIQSIIGRNDASQGNDGSQVAYATLTARIMQNNAGVTEQFNNLKRADEQTGRIILDLLPHIYDTERTVTVQTPRGDKKPVVINQQGGLINSMTTGEYDIEISEGSNFAVQKAEAMEKLIQLVGLNPQAILPRIADLVAENIDLENTNEIVKRLEGLLPPDVKAEKQGLPPPPPPPPPPEAQLMQMDMQLKQLDAEIKKQELTNLQQEMPLKVQFEQAKTATAQAKLQQTATDTQQKAYMAQQQTTTAAIKANAEITNSRMNALSQMAKTHADIAKSHAAIQKARSPTTSGSANV